ncbi:MAG: flagellar basal-body MS-ring/collar protein FliF [Pseudomonadota bacterium]
MNELLKTIESYGVARLAAIIGVSFGVAAALALIAARVGAPSMSVLYADAGYAEAQRIITRLDQDGVDHKVRDQGRGVTIMVPRKDVSRLRLDLAADGFDAGTGVGYEIFDDAQMLGATTFQQNINRLRALEGELARTLAAIDGVRTARVHLVMPERELFSRDRQTASASIVVDAPGGLDERSVRAIVNLVASAAPSLEPSRVTVLDARGQLLAAGADDQSADAMAGSVEDRKIAAEARLQRAVEDLVGRIVGSENVRVEVNADMDFSRITESSEIIDPDSQTVLSSTTVEETSNNVDPARSQGVSVANALPGADGAVADATAATSANQRLEETTNYEISKTVRNAVREEGLVVKRLSVAVAINGVAGIGADGAPTYAPRNADEIERIETIVKSAIGFNEARGDQVNVVDIPFSPVSQAPVGAIATSPSDLFESDDLMRLAELSALALIAFALVWFVLRPMLSAEAPARLATPSPVGAVADMTAGDPLLDDARLSLPQPDEGEPSIDLGQVDGLVKASSINKVAEVVKTHTNESANILRGWMREAS